jgi:hypothetical protein
MRPRIFIGTAAVMAGWLAACSKPASHNSQAARDLSLPTPAAADAPLVSTLEAGRPLARATAVQPSRRAPSPAPAMAHEMAAAPASAPQPEVTLPQVQPALSTPSLGLAQAPSHLPMDMATEWERNAAAGDVGAYPLPTPGPSHRDPTIMIRGGPGAIEDKCDIRPRGGRGGTAVNRSAPSFGRGIR